tara:strand:- start:364 stop:762 length:399 start_codon:yes stop_codon:yes gene_type:complete
MINGIITALRENKLHEVVIRMSQLNSKDLEKLLKTFLINDYIKLYRIRSKAEIVYEYDLPDSYTLTFKLYVEDKIYNMIMEFYSTKSFYNKQTDSVIDSGYYEIRLTKFPIGWKNVSTTNDKKVIAKLIKVF